MAELIINGKDHKFTDEEFPTLLSDLITVLHLNDIAIIAEVNGKIINKDSFTTTALSSGMKIELVKFVGGG